MTDASLEYLQLLAQSEILQGDLFITRKYQEDRPKDNQDFVQHSDRSVSASLMKINRLRDRCDFVEAQAKKVFWTGLQFRNAIVALLVKGDQLQGADFLEVIHENAKT